MHLKIFFRTKKYNCPPGDNDGEEKWWRKCLSNNLMWGNLFLWARSAQIMNSCKTWSLLLGYCSALHSLFISLGVQDCVFLQLRYLSDSLLHWQTWVDKMSLVPGLSDASGAKKICICLNCFNFLCVSVQGSGMVSYIREIRVSFHMLSCCKWHM